jgi:hypothetical protein
MEEIVSTMEHIAEVLADIQCGTGLSLRFRDGSLQVTDGEWTGRKWRLSLHMTDGEIVQTALAAVLAWHEHEARENFLYKGRAIFNPHLDLTILWERSEQIEVRR